MKPYDAIVIGTGQSGPPLAARLAKSGLQVAVIEQAQFGGTCVNNGCTPTKTLIASAYAAHLARRSKEYGVETTGPVAVDMMRVKARKDAVVASSRQSVEDWMRSSPNLTVYRAHGKFVDAHTVRAGNDTLKAERVFINVGARPLIPKLSGLDRVSYLTSESIMDVDSLPEHLVIVGGSYVGLEFAQMYRRFGARVTIVEMGKRLIGREDSDVSDAVKEILSAEHIDIRLDAECISLEPEEHGIKVKLNCTEGAPSVSATHVLLAVGRTPNTDALGLAEIGVKTDKRGYISVDDELRTSAANVYALGDCNGRGAFTHTSYNDYEIVADNLLDGANRKVTDRVQTYALYIDPPLGRVGMTEADAERDGLKVLIGKRPMTRVARAVEKGETQGFMKVMVDADSKRILGAAILGVGGDEVVQTLVDAIYARLPCSAVRHGVRIHPTVSELIPTVLEHLEPRAHSDA